MRKADFKARIKKIEIVNKVLAEDWEQSIKVILDEIELNDENLLELRQFKPNEVVSVEIKPVQISLFDDSLLSKKTTEVPEQGPPKLKVVKPGQKETCRDGSFIYIEEEDIDNEGPGGDPFEDEDIIKEWRFDDKK
ncbi:hypothetical protein [Desulfolucanica intricata]|uniref:hypothetical protein n=1 Tax=Desulfolucanica intricata TaxID=1285191 RepID=UPI00082F178E|nr:hypothetical protein [Desulfolucanica intricata]